MSLFLRNLLVLTCAMLLAAAGARADLWAYVDEKGVAHFAAQQLDSRYQLFFQGGDAPLAAETGTATATEPARAVAVPTASSRLVVFFDISPSYKSVKYLLREAATVNAVDYELLKAVIATESGFDANAVSPKGAVGLMQVMPSTAQDFGLAADGRRSVAQKLADPQLNIRTGARVLGHLTKQFPGRLDLVLAAYNAGEGAVRRAGNRIPDYRETQNYVRTVMQIYALLKPPAVMARQAAAATVRLGPVSPVVGPALGGALGRANMPPPVIPATPANPARTPVLPTALALAAPEGAPLRD